MRCIVLLFIVICPFAKTMRPELFVSVRPDWEICYRNMVVDNYSNEDLREHFEALRSQGVVPAHIHNALNTIIGFPTGRSTISDIVAAVEPRLYYANSLRKIVGYIGAKKDAVLTAEEALRVAFGLVSSINPRVFVNAETFNTYITTALAPEWYNKLNNSPERIVQSIYTGDLFTTNYVGAANFLHTQFNIVVQAIEAEIDNYLFQFDDGDDCYTRSNKMIAVRSDANPKACVVSGPRLSTIGTVVGLVTRDVEFSIDERLFHEILHYVHITLRKEYVVEDFTLLGRVLINNGFNPVYTGVLKSLWTDQEEFRTITGLFVHPITRVLSYSRQSESRYLNDKLKPFRCSHSFSYCTKVPLYFVNAVLATEIDLHYFPE